MAGKFSDWDPYTRYVQGGLVDGQFLNAGHTLIAAGPPRLANLGWRGGRGGWGGSGSGRRHTVRRPG